ncbi:MULTISPECIES: envelope stress response membrane protein PspC [unclassified Brenneria]|uniref:envelope stress response membrane protein PspC n=1 Tax=unclassified Brenneria TaxID=2634434 RepID=UPI0015529AE0|nr:MULTISPECIES: envelope stress response membrane protein PspC [unclassified Brenneria]MBJ7220950.1 envelope stress response membrane protein PspC [Brenneria sp. L3-3C-1]MEE3642191.1 envelope stress response membrane protein PspC [Brenneria sp. L3_3C_1]MEE3650436.1 envelope stress response membrane protein PspC [Brenneria sp. HEZEL_4_2_4]NPD00392.1 envelope stress response membrane protein PspC [Brenneria sp. hezel4-2-4]
MKNTWSGKTLYRIPEEGMLKGVCAGLARYFDVPVKLLRVIVVLSMFFGLFFFTILAYIILSFILEPAPANSYRDASPQTPNQLLNDADATLNASEQRLRNIERYVTSDTFGVESRFRQL